jgi:signal transduction histidine kinase
MESILAKALGQDPANPAVEEKRELLSRLLARLAHEIRNPLSSLDIHLQLLDEDLSQMAPEQREKLAGRLDIIRGEVHRLENIVQQFLGLAGPSAVNLQSVDVSKIVRHVCGLLGPEAAARGIEVVSEAPEGLPAVAADPVQLTQALLNLVINGIQAVSGKGRVEVAARAEPERKRMVLSVRDTGPGVPAESASVIFEPFFTTKPEGSGLGLWIVQQIAMAHGGAVEASDAQGGGAIFSIQLPLGDSRK